MPNILTYARISRDIYEPDDSTWAPPYKRLTNLKAISPLVAAAYQRSPHDPIVIAYRGSVSKADWSSADADIAQGALPLDHVGKAFDFFGRVIASNIPGMKDRTRRIVIVGHSLGGALAALVAARITTRPVIGVTFNAPRIEALMHCGRYHEPAVDDLEQSSPLGLVGGLMNDKWISARDRMVAGVGGAPTLSLPRINGTNTWHLRLTFGGVADLVSYGPQSIGHTYIVRIAPVSPPQNPVMKGLETGLRSLPLAPVVLDAAHGVGQAIDLYKKVQAAHLMDNMLQALALHENAPIAHSRPRGW